MRVGDQVSACQISFVSTGGASRKFRPGRTDGRPNRSVGDQATVTEPLDAHRAGGCHAGAMTVRARPDPGSPRLRRRDIAEVPALEIVSTAALHLMSAAAVNLGLAEDLPEHRDLDEARTLIEALAGLVTAGAPRLGSPPRRAAARRPAQPAARVPGGLRGAGRPGRGPRREAHRPGVTHP